jgi:hypothetical protein
LKEKVTLLPGGLFVLVIGLTIELFTVRDKIRSVNTLQSLAPDYPKSVWVGAALAVPLNLFQGLGFGA